MTAKFGYVTTACRLCEDIVPPDGGDLRYSAVDARDWEVGPTAQLLFPQLRERTSQRHCHGEICFRWTTKSNDHQPRSYQPRSSNLFTYTRDVPLLQWFQVNGQKNFTRKSGENGQMFVQRKVCRKWLQQISIGQSRRKIHRLQQKRNADTAFKVPHAGKPAQVSRLHEGFYRFRHKQAQPQSRQIRRTTSAISMATKKTGIDPQVR